MALQAQAQAQGRGQGQEQDYWPGFLDILVNVMLYLLLLVSSFALGAVALTLHSMQQQLQLFSLDVDQAVALKGLEVSEQDRRRLMLRLESLDVEAMLKRREQLERERQLLEARRKEVERELAQQRRRAQEVQEVQEVQRRRRAHSEVDEGRQELAQLQQQRVDYEFRLSVLGSQLGEVERNLAQVSEALEEQKQSQQASARQWVSDFRVGAALSEAGFGGDVQGLVERRLGQAAVAAWEFGASELIWPQGKVPPISGMALETGDAWRVVALTDTGNVRLVRESFARVNSVRDVLIARGFERERIRVEVLDGGAALGVDGRILRTVLMVPDRQAGRLAEDQ